MQNELGELRRMMTNAHNEEDRETLRVILTGIADLQKAVRDLKAENKKLKDQIGA